MISTSDQPWPFHPEEETYPWSLAVSISDAVNSHPRMMGWDYAKNGFLIKIWTDLPSRTITDPTTTLDITKGSMRMRTIIQSLHEFAHIRWLEQRTYLLSHNTGNVKLGRTAEEVEIWCYYTHQKIIASTTGIYSITTLKHLSTQHSRKGDNCFEGHLFLCCSNRRIIGTNICCWQVVSEEHTTTKHYASATLC